MNNSLSNDYDKNYLPVVPLQVIDFSVHWLNRKKKQGGKIIYVKCVVLFSDFKSQFRIFFGQFLKKNISKGKIVPFLSFQKN